MLSPKYSVPISTVFHSIFFNGAVNSAAAVDAPHVFKPDGRLARVIEGERMLEPLLFRAHMHEQQAEPRFYDTASRQLLSDLGISPDKNLSRGSNVYQRQRLAQCQWVDRQALMFFERFPQAQGIELWAGLSTRFHRLSQNLDWPRFYWHSVNDERSAPFLTAAFPKSDHFYIHGCQNPLSDWRNTVLEHKHDATLLIIDSQKPIATLEDWQTLCSAIRFALQTHTAPLHLIVAHSLTLDKARVDAVCSDMPNLSMKELARFTPAPSSLIGRLSRFVQPKWPQLSHFVCERT